MRQLFSLLLIAAIIGPTSAPAGCSGEECSCSANAADDVFESCCIPKDATATDCCCEAGDCADCVSCQSDEDDVFVDTSRPRRVPIFATWLLGKSNDVVAREVSPLTGLMEGRPSNRVGPAIHIRLCVWLT